MIFCSMASRLVDTRRSLSQFVEFFIAIVDIVVEVGLRKDRAAVFGSAERPS